MLLISATVHSCPHPRQDWKVLEKSRTWTGRLVRGADIPGSTVLQRTFSILHRSRRGDLQSSVEGVTLTQPRPRLGNILDLYCKNTEDFSREDLWIACDQSRLDKNSLDFNHKTGDIPGCCSSSLDNCFLVSYHPAIVQNITTTQLSPNRLLQQ